MIATFAVWPKSNAKFGKVHWLITLVDAVCENTTGTDRFLVSRHLFNKYMTYSLFYSVTQTEIRVQGQGDQLRVETYKTEAVDPFMIALPKRHLVMKKEFILSPEGLKVAGRWIADELCCPTIFSEKIAKRIHVSTQPRFDEKPPVFFGGFVKKVILDMGSTHDKVWGTLHNIAVLVKGLNEDKSVLVTTISDKVLNVGLSADKEPEQWVIVTDGFAEPYHKVELVSPEAFASFYQQM